MTKSGQRAYKRALSEIRGTEWWDVLFSTKSIASAAVDRELKEFTAACDKLWPDESEPA